MLTRREFIGSALLPLASAQERPQPLRVAIVTTIYKYLSHGQHIGDRFLIGYPIDGEWHKPNVKVVSLYVDQKPEGDLSQERASEFGFRVYPTIAEALCCGGDSLACDAVLIVAEHGNYPRNDKGQILYPRYEFFEQCVKVFEKSGRAVPVYNDKHLSYSFEKAQSMVASSKKLKFPMLGGSSLPVTWRLPSIEMPFGAHIEEARDGRRRRIGPHGFPRSRRSPMHGRAPAGRGNRRTSRSAIDGDAAGQAGWSKDLLSAALSRSDTPLGLTVKDGRTQDLTGSGRSTFARQESRCLPY